MTAKRPATAKGRHTWEFKPRFRRHAFGWKSQPAIQRIKQGVSEIKKVARRDPALAAEGAVLFLERVSPAIEQVDGSSGAIGTAVNRAIAELVPILAEAPADATTRDAWLERLWEAYVADQMPYIERLADHWGELCGSKEVASAWADRLLDVTRMALSADKTRRGHFHGTIACLSALYRAERYGEIVDVLGEESLWLYETWAVKALGAMGKKPEAIQPSSGLVDEAYGRYGLRAHRGGTYLATFRDVARRYPHKRPEEILADLGKATPGDEGKWFAAAKEPGLNDAASEQRIRKLASDRLSFVTQILGRELEAHLRTACNLECRELRATRPAGFVVSELSALDEAIPALIDAVAKESRFAEPRVAVVVWRKK